MKLSLTQWAGLAILAYALAGQARGCKVDPTPAPEPLGPLAVAVVVETGDQLTIGQVGVARGMVFRDWLAAAGHTFRLFDPNDQAPADWQWALDAGAARKPPWLATKSKAGTVKAYDLPATVDAAKKLLGGSP